MRSFDEVASGGIRNTLKVDQLQLRPPLSVYWRSISSGTMIWPETDLEFKRDKYRVQKMPQEA